MCKVLSEPLKICDMNKTCLIDIPDGKRKKESNLTWPGRYRMPFFCSNSRSTYQNYTHQQDSSINRPHILLPSPSSKKYHSSHQSPHSSRGGLPLHYPLVLPNNPKRQLISCMLKNNTKQDTLSCQIYPLHTHKYRY